MEEVGTNVTDRDKGTRKGPGAGGLRRRPVRPDRGAQGLLWSGSGTLAGAAPRRWHLTLRVVSSCCSAGTAR